MFLAESGRLRPVRPSRRRGAGARNQAPRHFQAAGKPWLAAISACGWMTSEFFNRSCLPKASRLRAWSWKQSV